MAYPHYMNMGFGQHDPSNAYMMSSMQMQSRSGPSVSNHVPQDLVNRPSTMLPNRSGGGGGGVVGGGGSAAHKRKLLSDPNRPKRPTSAYFFFIQLEREAAARRGEKITRVAEWTKLVSAKWRELSVAEKVPFNRMAASDKARYTQQMAIYTGKDANRPKRPQSAYILWLADFRAQMKDKFVENKELLRAAGEEWRKLTSIDKIPYEQRAELEKQKYGDAMKDYNMGCNAKRQKVESESQSASNGTGSSYQASQPQGAPPSSQRTDFAKPPPQEIRESNTEDEDEGDENDAESEEDDEYE